MKHSYRKLAIEIAIDGLIMYFVMYAMIAMVAHLYPNLNNLYMTLMMVAPMTIVMLVSMWSMYPSKTINLVICAGAALAFIASFVAMRTQAAIGDKEFLRSMIPHHSGAILMCEQASISDPEVVRLCGKIVKSQTAEIAQMQQILKRY